MYLEVVKGTWQGASDVVRQCGHLRVEQQLLLLVLRGPADPAEGPAPAAVAAPPVLPGLPHSPSTHVATTGQHALLGHHVERVTEVGLAAMHPLSLGETIVDKFTSKKMLWFKDGPCIHGLNFTSPGANMNMDDY